MGQIYHPLSSTATRLSRQPVVSLRNKLQSFQYYIQELGFPLSIITFFLVAWYNDVIDYFVLKRTRDIEKDLPIDLILYFCLEYLTTILEKIYYVTLSLDGWFNPNRNKYVGFMACSVPNLKNLGKIQKDIVRSMTKGKNGKMACKCWSVITP